MSSRQRGGGAMLLGILLFMFLSGAGTPSASAGTIRVPDDFPTIQAGIAAALNGDVVEVAPGTYNETLDFMGKEITVQSRDGADLTVIDGGQTGAVVRFVSGEGALAVIKGFTLTNGSANGSEGGVFCFSSSPTIEDNTIEFNQGSAFAGGVVCLFASPTIRDNRIRDNQAIGAGAGGIYIRQGSPLIEDNTILRNTATGSGAGGIACLDQSDPVLRGNTIEDNEGDGFGGGVRSFDSTVTLENNTIDGNQTRVGPGGGVCLVDSIATLTGNTIIDNISQEKGGGVFCLKAEYVIETNTIANNLSFADGGGICVLDSAVLEKGGSLRIVGNEIEDNCADLDGGGLYCQNSSPLIEDNRFLRNDSFFQRGGGIACASGSSPTIRLNDIRDNDAVEGGGGISVRFCSLSITENQITENVTDLGGGGGIRCEEGTITIANNTIAQNGSGIDGGGGVFSVNVTLTLSDNAIDFNLTDGDGAGCHLRNDLSLGGGGLPFVTVTGNDICHNAAVFEFGGGIYCAQLMLDSRIENNLIQSNDSPNFEGAGIFCTAASPTIIDNIITANSLGGVACVDGSDPLIEGCEISFNTAFCGGGIKCVDSSPTITNCRILDNLAVDAGGGIYLFQSCPTITNCLVARNTTDLNDGGGIYAEDSCPVIQCCTIVENFAGTISAFGKGGGLLFFLNDDVELPADPSVGSTILWGNGARTDQDFRDQRDIATVRYSNVGGGVDGEGNISFDPHFRLGTEFELDVSSPCRNAGDPSGIGLPSVDLFGDPRITFGRVDMGADEFFRFGGVGVRSFRP